MRGLEIEWRRLRYVAIDTETVSQGLEIILQIWRLGGHFFGAHGASVTPPMDSSTYILFPVNLILKRGGGRGRNPPAKYTFMRSASHSR